ncbi:uncharacterized protein TrAtP1_006289 [Trichoderma atroviride]|uniref:uncharacterized protein n=1 Tax=Hypocrea atroviridis TaxID=63577 RepID=UPI0033179861|nr:hypothetical protein TrAtP1_006289 [Trichoderma atroviride]
MAHRSSAAQHENRKGYRFCIRKIWKSKLAIADVNATLLKQTAKELKEAYPTFEVLPIELDAANEDSTIKAVETAFSKFGQIDHAVNNIGITGHLAPSTSVSTKDFRNLLDINLTSLWTAQREQIRIMLQQEPIQLECAPTRIGETNQTTINRGLREFVFHLGELWFARLASNNSLRDKQTWDYRPYKKRKMRTNTLRGYTN